mgnify:CR=1 FL=1
MIKNYTSTVPIEKSINHIESKLVAHGAKDIMKRYGPEGKLESICFIILLNGNSMSFKLPAKIGACYEVLLKSRVNKISKESRNKIMEQAARTAWKIVSDWVDIEMSMIELQQKEFLEVFLSYVYDPRNQQTFYESLKESKFLALTK